jgi:hypothetical protein
MQQAEDACLTEQVMEDIAAALMNQHGHGSAGQSSSPKVQQVQQSRCVLPTCMSPNGLKLPKSRDVCHDDDDEVEADNAPA